MRRALTLAAQLLISLLAIYLVLRIGNLPKALAAAAGAHPGYLLAAVATWALSQVLGIWKWHGVNQLSGISVRGRDIASAYLVGMFFNTFLPSGFGGDAVRAYKLARLSGSGKASVASVIVDRYLALYGLVVVSAAGMLFSPELRAVVPAGLLVLALGGGALPLLAPWLLGREACRGTRERWSVLQRLVDLTAAPAAGALAVRIGALSLVIQYLQAVMHFFIILALGLTVSLPYVLAFIPLMILISSMPVSVNGLGIREGSLVFFLGRVGIAPTSALAVGMLSLGMLLLVGAVGGIVFLLEGRSPRARQA